MTFDIQDLVIAASGVLAALPAAYLTARKRVTAELTTRLAKISGGRLSTLEDLVAEALAERKIRESPISVYGSADLWSELRRGGYKNAEIPITEFDTAPGRLGIDKVDVSVIEVEDDDLERFIEGRAEGYVLIYKTGAPYRGALPPGTQVTFANSQVTLEARLLEMLRYRAARKVK